MTTILEAPATATSSVAGQVRAELARQRMSGRELARRTSRDSQYWWRRLSGEKPFDVEDLAVVPAVLDVPVGALVAPLDAGRGTSPIGRYGPTAGDKGARRGDWRLAA